jgi:tetratricopeptide (TPR) repeat protein
MKKKVVPIMFCFALLCGLTGCDIMLRSFKRYDCRTDAVPNPKTSGDFVAASRYHFNRREYECAYAAAEEALRLQKDNANAFNARAMAHYGFEEYSAALSDFQTSVWLNPQNPDTFYGRSIVYEKQNDPENALKNIDMAIELAKNSSGYRSYVPSWTNQRGFTRLKKGDTEGALEDFSAAISMEPDNPFYYDDRARLYRRLGKITEAEKDERQSAELKSAEEQTNAAQTNAAQTK